MRLKEFDLSGKVAVITGSDNSDRTVVFAKSLAESGADIAVVASNDTDIDKLINEMTPREQKSISLTTGISNSESVENAVETILSRFNKIDVLVNDAASVLVKPFADSTEKEWQNILEDNLKSVMLWCQIVGKHMLERRAGRIINIISALSIRGLPNHTIYCASMGAIHQFTKALALEWAKQNIRVNAIAHGWISGEADKGNSTEDSLVRFIPMRRFGKPSDLTGVLAYLASDASEFINGETIFIDGGLISHG